MSHKISGNDFVKIRKNKFTLTLNKPAYIGICILELSKVLIYKFHYDYIKNKYGNNSKLLFTDTDRLMYEIKTVDIYEEFSNDKEIYLFMTRQTYCIMIKKCLTYLIIQLSRNIIISRTPTGW